MPLSAGFLRDRYQEYLQYAEEVQNDFTKNDREIAEAFENLALSQFYTGNYRNALENFNRAYELHKGYPQDRENPRICILAGLASFRLGDFSKAEHFFSTAIIAANSANAQDLKAVAECNLAILMSNQVGSSNVTEHLIRAISIGAKLYAKNSKEYKEIARTVIAGYIRIGDYTTAERIIQRTPFTDQESALLSAGCSFLAGHLETAQETLLTYKAQSTIQPLQEMKSTLNSDPIENSNTDNTDHTDDAVSVEKVQAASASLSLSPSLSDIQTSSSSPRGSSNNVMMAMIDKKASLSQKEKEGEALDTSVDKKDLLEEGDIRDEDEVEVEVDEGEMEVSSRLMEAQIDYNIAVICIKKKKYDEAKAYLETALIFAKEVKRLVGDSGTATGDAAPYMREGAEVELLTVDRTLVPKIVLSQILAARAETLLLGAVFRVAVDLQSGLPMEDFEDEQEVLREVAIGLDSSVEALACTGLIGLPSAYSEVQCTATIQLEPVPPPVISLDGGEQGNSRVGSPSTSLVADESGAKRRGSGHPPSRESREKSSRPQSMEKEKEKTEASLKTNKPKSDKGATNKGLVQRSADMVLATDIRDRYQNLVDIALSTGDKESVTATNAMILRQRFHKSVKKGGKAPSAARGPDPGALAVRSEMIAVKHTLQASEAQVWIQWALSVCDGVGLGFLGLEGTADDVTDDATRKHPMEFYRDVKNHLIDAEATLIPDEDVSTRMLLSFALLKLCAQLNLRKECTGYVDSFETYAARVGDPEYIALSKKYRYDVEEWSNSAAQLTTSVAKLRRCLLLLGHAKAYHRAADRTKDFQLQRDAIKRVMNVFSEVSQVPDSTGMNLDAGSQQELDKLSPDEIEEKEKTDIYWLRRFALLRAGEYFRLLKNRKPVEEDEEEFLEETGEVEDNEVEDAKNVSEYIIE
eukprot:gene6888-13966_t